MPYKILLRHKISTGSKPTQRVVSIEHHIESLAVCMTRMDKQGSIR